MCVIATKLWDPTRIRVQRLNRPIGPTELLSVGELAAGATGPEVVAFGRNPEWAADAPLMLIVAGQVIRDPELEDYIVPDGAVVIVVPDPLAPLLFAALGALVDLIVGNALILLALGAASLAYSKLLSIPDPPQFKNSGPGSDSPTYAWAGIQTAYGTGARIPIVYGIHRLGGQVIASKVYEIDLGRDVLGLLVALGEGPLSKIAGLELSLGQTEWNNRGGLFQPSPDPFDQPSGIRVDGSEVSQNAMRVSVRAGTQFQSPIAQFALAVTTFPLAVLLPKSIYRTYVTNGQLVTSVRVRIEFAGLFSSENGEEIPKEVTFESSFRKSTGGFGFSAPKSHSITALRRSRFLFSFPMEFPEADRWELRVRRVTEDDDDKTLSSANWVAVVEEATAANGTPIRYIHQALLGIEIEATEALQGPTPQINLEAWGRPVDHTWNGSTFLGNHFFESATGKFWGRDPAWCLVDFLRNFRFGLGRWWHFSQIDLDKIQLWSDWNQELVDDGKGGTHPRNYFDGVLDDGADGWEQVLKICRAGMAIPILVGRTFSIKFEHDDTPAFPRPVTQLFASSNIRDVRIDWNDQTQRPNLLDIQILDEKLDYEQNVISVEDPDALGIHEPGLLNTEPVRRELVSAFGITRAAQARRLAAFTHAANRLLNRKLTFRCNIDALAAEIADRIAVETDIGHFFDTPTQGVRSTNVAGSATNTIKLDTQVDTTGGGYAIAITQTDLTVKVRNITAPTGVIPPNTAITFDGVAINHPARAVVGFGKAGKVTTEWVITNITLDTENLDRVVEAFPWAPAIFAIPATMELDEGETFGTLELAPIPKLSSLAPDAIQLVLESPKVGLVSWQRPDAINTGQARVYIRPKEDKSIQTVGIRPIQPWSLAWQGQGAEARITSLEPGVAYEVTVVTQDRHGAWESPGATTELQVVAPEFPDISPKPAPIRYDSARKEGVRLEWEEVRSDTLDHYEVRRGPHWLGGTVVARTRMPWADIHDGHGFANRYQVRPRHTNGLYSGPELPVVHERTAVRMTNDDNSAIIFYHSG